jgi:predicted O-methyltransferase YrrM
MVIAMRLREAQVVPVNEKMDGVHMFDPKKITAIPGMIEPIEQQTLYGLASQLSLRPEDQMVEFGSFFGRSTECLAQGLSDNPQRKASNQLHAYDSFGCAAQGGFAVHVNAFAQSGNVSNLLVEDGERLNFYPVFEHYLAERIESALVCPAQNEIRDSEAGEIRQIALMHIDSPKFYDELRYLLERFFPRLRDGALVVFQDFFYHWSATLIAAVEAMRQMHILEYHLSAASSLVTQVNRTINAEVIAELDSQMANPAQVTQLILNAIEASKKIQIDRPEIFIPRLWLAAYQHLWEQHKSEDATDLIVKFFGSGEKLAQPVLNDYLEMMRFGFSIRKLYELDHN